MSSSDQFTHSSSCMTLDEALDACEPCWGSVGANGYDGAQRRYQVMRRLVDGSLSLWEYDGTSTVCNLERLPEEAQRLNWQPLYPSEVAP